MKYGCNECKLVYEYGYTSGCDKIEVVAPEGEKLTITVVTCPHCGSMQLPEDENNVGWKIRTESDIYPYTAVV